MRTITVAICTHNRAEYLGLALESLGVQTLPSRSFEVLVVDNRSSDGTRDLVQRFATARGNVRYVYEERLGLSEARNRAMMEARGEYIAYLDDDAVASPAWLERIWLAFENLHPTPGCVGGEIEPIWEVPRPDWLPDQLLGYFTVLQLGATDTFLESTGQCLWGANMAFPVAVIRRVGGFDAGLGRVGERLISSEEILLQRKLVKEGYRLYYDPRAKVKHHVVASRLRPEWLYQRAFAQGVSEAIMKRRLEGLTGWGRVREFARSTGDLVLRLPELYALFYPDSRQQSVVRRCQALVRLGRARGYWTSLGSG